MSLKSHLTPKAYRLARRIQRQDMDRMPLTQVIQMALEEYVRNHA